MTISDENIRKHLRLREDGKWEFKSIEFKGNQPSAPTRDNLADEIAAFANGSGGFLVCGVSDIGEIQGLTPEQLSELDKYICEICTDSIKPALTVDLTHRELDGRAFILVEIPQGDDLHSRSGYAYIRQGATKRPLSNEERLRITQKRAQSRYIWTDNQPVPETGINSLNERFWIPILSETWTEDPEKGLLNARLLTVDEFGKTRATVAGILIGTENPQFWLPHAMIIATRYRGTDRSSGQLDSQNISGPIQSQIADAVKFVHSNMQVAARKTPHREDIPQYSIHALFEAIVNAVVHRDYSIRSRRIRISMFKDRLEIETPGELLNGVTTENMHTTQTTRNEIIASVFGRLSVADIPGSEHRKYLMERRGDGVTIILSKTKATCGYLPKYEVIASENLVLTIPSARLQLKPSEGTITVHSKGDSLPDVTVAVFFPNQTCVQNITDEAGNAKLDLYTSDLPMTVFVAADGYSAGLYKDWLPNTGGLVIELTPLPSGGSTFLPNSTGELPGIHGQLNPKKDSLGRTYLYANNVAIEHGKIQPVHFSLGQTLRLTDAFGVELTIKILDIVGQSSLIEYRSYK